MEYLINLNIGDCFGTTLVEEYLLHPVQPGVAVYLAVLELKLVKHNRPIFMTYHKR